MGHEVTVGGERLGSGNKMKAYLHGYERSTHDLSYIRKTTMSSGTLVPFLSKPALPGDTWDIQLDLDILTMPTVGPLFGSWIAELYVFQAPVRLYQGRLHMNELGIGNDMSKVKLPVMELEAWGYIDPQEDIDGLQINPSSLLAHLNVMGVGYHTLNTEENIIRHFNGIPLLAYWDIYKCYYANKQEEIGAVIHKPVNATTPIIGVADIWDAETGQQQVEIAPIENPITVYFDPSARMVIQISPGTPLSNDITADQFILEVAPQLPAGPFYQYSINQLFERVTINVEQNEIYASKPRSTPLDPIGPITSPVGMLINNIRTIATVDTPKDTEPIIRTFPLSNIDDMRKEILAHTDDTAFLINGAVVSEPYKLQFHQNIATHKYAKQFAQEGLALKAYKSDLFNNWIQTDWIDGPNGIAEVTAIDTSGGSFTIDELQMNKKVYDMLNRIAISGGSYDDWLDAVYTHKRQRQAENPMFLGGLIRDVVFQEVISQTATESQPLGTLAGRGRMGQRHKGGEIIVKVDEPSYIIGIASLTPRLDYSQGNAWDMTNLKTMNDFHKPALDQIGFQDLITDQLAWWDTGITPAGVVVYKSAGKQPAWTNYMTDVNTVRGNFALEAQQMFMVLNRKYAFEYGDDGKPTIGDMTTYIDPSKFNHIFADTRRDAQNFWVQIGVKIEARRKMSAKVMPNL